ncbi:MAG TPA: non-heme iron oxygenase ferredoxin subunit [Acidimicrobiales bacterium]|nr:non-heme iron oxygenase ferredoxin subunit [Acidimicrobiales bacterium]
MSREIRLKLDDLDDGVPKRVEGGPFGICVARDGEAVYALADRCSHQLWFLSDGEVDLEERTIECTKHGSTFSLEDGRPQCLPATKPVDVYPVRREGDEVVITAP